VLTLLSGASNMCSQCCVVYFVVRVLSGVSCMCPMLSDASSIWSQCWVVQSGVSCVCSQC
jgi:hypothetical protein